MNIDLTKIQTLVVKVGTTLLSGKNGFDGRLLEDLIKDLAAIKRERGINILIVSSGAIGCGMDRLGIRERPKLLRLKQATAAVGQARLMHYYETLFQTYGEGLQTAQVLLSAADLDDRERYLNIRNTLQALFDLRQVIPVVNENDSVATEELKFGDNDTLAARVAAKLGADVLVILSDVDGLYDKDPAKHKDAELVRRVDEITASIEGLAGGASAETSVGGMKTKLAAARIATASGVRAIIANGHRPRVVSRVLADEIPSTTFPGAVEALSHRKRWIAFGRAPRGTLLIDDGARKALVENGKSLLAAGIVAVRGHFEVGAAVRVADSSGTEVACGLVNYSSHSIERIKGCKSTEIQDILGRKDFDEVIHRNNLVVR